MNLKSCCICIAAVAAWALASIAQAAALGVVSWNMGNLPNTAPQQAGLRTIFEGMGQFDLLAMVETDTASALDTAVMARSVFGVPGYASLISSADGGGDRTGFVYNASTLSLLSAVESFSGSMTHRILRAHFQPVGGPSGTDFYVYSVHLKSGDGSAERASRLAEAQGIRADADGLGSANVLFVGDFNWQGSGERGASPALSAFDAFVAEGSGQAFDPANAIGAWRDNASFKALHTNDPGGAMDDRFDMQLISGELADGAGLEYVAGSYRVYGNNGTHAMNGDIRTGTGAPAAVLDALYGFSDHLPVMASYSFDVPEPGGAWAVATATVWAFRRRRLA